MSAILCVTIIVLCVSVRAYNEEKPIYKWSPVVFRNLKKDVINYKCGAERTLCGFRWSSRGMFTKMPCCQGLLCERIGTYNVCLRSTRKPNQIDLIY